MARKGALANMDDDAVLDRIAGGEIMRTIAKELGVAKQSLRERLFKHPRYKECISAQAESFVEDCVEEHRSLPADMPAIARARARADVAFRYAKAHNQAYADRPDQSGGGIRIIINDGSSAGVTIEHEQTGATLGATSVRVPDNTVDNQ